MLDIIPYYVDMLGVRLIFFTIFIIGLFAIILFGFILWMYFIKPQVDEYNSKEKSKWFHKELTAKFISNPLPSYYDKPSDVISLNSSKCITMVTKSKLQKITYTGPLQQLSVADRSILYTGKPDSTSSKNLSSSVHMPSISSINSLREACRSPTETKIEMDALNEKRLSVLSDDDKSSIPVGQSAFSNCGSSRVYQDPKSFLEMCPEQKEVPQGTVYHSAIRTVLQTRSMKPVYKSSFKSDRPTNDARDEFDFQGFSLLQDSSPKEEGDCVPMDDVISIEQRSTYSFYSGLPFAETKEASQNIEDRARFAIQNDVEMYATIKPKKQSWSTTGSLGQRSEGVDESDRGNIENESIGGSSYVSYKSSSFVLRAIPVKPPKIEIGEQVISKDVNVQDLPKQSDDHNQSPKDSERLPAIPDNDEEYETGKKEEIQIDQNETYHVTIFPPFNEPMLSVKKIECNPPRIPNRFVSSQSCDDVTETINSDTNQQSDCEESTSTEEPSSKSLENLDAIVSNIYSNSPGTLSNEFLNLDFKKKMAFAGNASPRASMSSGINRVTTEQVYVDVVTEDIVTVL